jgi:hypothetical protein
MLTVMDGIILKPRHFLLPLRMLITSILSGPWVTSRVILLGNKLLISIPITTKVSYFTVSYALFLPDCRRRTLTILSFTFSGIFDTKNPVLCNPDMRIMRYLQDNYDFMQTQSLKHYETSEYWLVVRGILAQLDGLLAGFMDGQASIDEGNARRVLHKDKESDTVLLTDKEKDDALAALDMTTIDKPSLLHFLLLNGNGDMFTLIEKLADGDKKNNITFSGVDCSRTSRRLTEEFKMDDQAMDGNFVYEYGTSVLDRKRAKLTGQGQDGYRTDHCSALVKVLPDGSDVIYGHNTWDDYRNMGPRIFKHYIYPKWPLNVVSYHSKCRPQGTKCMKQCAIREKSPPSHTYFSSSPGWLTSVDDFYTTFTTPFPSSAGDGDVDTNTDGGILCGCECGRQVSEQASIEDGDVMILETANEVESAVRENILDARVSAVEGAAPPSSPVKSGGGRLAIIETSLEIYSPELYDLIVPTTLLSWVRARTANTLAQSGADWAKHFSFDHSGTYPNQWIILDFDKFSKSNSYFKKSELLPGFLTIMEEMPGMIRSKDQTEYLKKNTYWASYNIPFYNDLSLYSKNTQLCQTQQNVYVHKNETLPGVDANANSDMENYRLGHSNCYSSCARAKLFARLHKDIVDIPSALKVLSHNDYKHDKESFGNPCEEIACREDLQPLDEKMNVFGAIDTKVSSVVEADTLYRGTASVIKGHDTVLKDSSPTVLSDNLTPKPLTFPLPLIEPEVEDISIQGGDDSVDMMSSRPRDDRSSSPLRYKMPRLFARQGPTHDTQNKPFCWSDFEARHDAWVVRTRGSLTPTGRRRLREGGEKWRKRKPAFR